MKEFDTFADLQASTQSAVGKRLLCRERANAEYIVQAADYTALAGDVTFANGLVGKLKINGLINVDQFGAIGDASTDNTVAINQAIERANTLSVGLFCSGLYFPSGRYLTSGGHLITKSGFTVRTGGRGSAQILNTSVNSTTFYVSTTTPMDTLIYGVSFINISMDCTNQNTLGSHIIFDRCQGCIITNCWIRNHYKNVVYKAGNNNWISDSEIDSFSVTTLVAGSSDISIERRQVTNGSLDSVDGLQYDKLSSLFLCNSQIRSSINGSQDNINVEAVDGLYITGTHIGFADRSCIRFNPAQSNLYTGNVQIGGNTFLDANSGGLFSEYGMLVENTNGFATLLMRDFTIDCNVAQCATHGYWLKAAVENISIKGSVRASGSHNIRVDSGEDISIQCKFKDAGQSIATSSHIRLFGGANFKINSTFDGSGLRALTTSGGVVAVNVSNCQGNVFGETMFSISHSVTTRDIFTGNTADTSNILASDASIIFLPLEHRVFSVTGTTNINNLGLDANISNIIGRTVTLLFNDVLTVSSSLGNIRLKDGDFLTSENASLTLTYNGTYWAD